MIFFLILFGKSLSFFSRRFNIGNGGTWPGEIAIKLNSDIFFYFLNQLKKGLIIIAGTNGKTTTAKMVRQIINGNSIYNDSGANLLNGIVSAFIQKANLFGKIDANWAILEVDENTLPIILSQLNSKTPAGSSSKFSKEIIIVLLNLFRDQLDRYGEVDTIARKWYESLKSLKSASLILNADDPQIAHLGEKHMGHVIYFGISRKEKYLNLKEHATDSTYCPSCRSRLEYEGTYFSHIGVWFCPKCLYKRPKLDISNWKSPLPGLYNEYNTLAAVSVGKKLGLSDSKISQTLSYFSPAFGRQEEIEVRKRRVKIFLSKNPAGFNASLRTVIDLKPDVILVILNDRVPDGRDVSWIWDVDFEMIPENVKIIVSGDRVYDMALRIKYTLKQFNNTVERKLEVIPKLSKAIEVSLEKINSGDTLYILPTYSAMLDVRKILKGKKIL